MRRDAFRYDLPEELIASRPTAARDGARLLVFRDDGLEHARMLDLPDCIAPGSLVVLNDTRVVPARLFGVKRGSGGRVELLLLRSLDGERYRALGRASKPLRPGSTLEIGDGALVATVLEKGDDGVLVVRLAAREGTILDAIEAHGHVPLPPYMKRGDDADDRARYQTIFAKSPGAAAAPTAGLHLSEAIFARLAARDVRIATVTLHVGLGTFQPVSVDDFDDHPMHSEALVVPEETVRAIADARDRDAPVVAIGTTVVRALESAADPSREGHVVAREGETRLLIQPGYALRVVDQLMTNFHLPESTLLALVCAFGGTERVLAAYRVAVAERYRFFSYGDAMLLSRRA